MDPSDPVESCVRQVIPDALLITETLYLIIIRNQSYECRNSVDLR